MRRILTPRACVLVTVAVLSLTATACGDDDGTFGRGDADTVVDVTLKDFEFAGLPAAVQGEKVFFATRNEGPDQHELEILDASGEAVDEIEAHPAGESHELAIRLDPGTYTVQCILETPQGQAHDQLGMKNQLRVQ